MKDKTPAAKAATAFFEKKPDEFNRALAPLMNKQQAQAAWGKLDRVKGLSKKDATKLVEAHISANTMDR
jgi:hypothetical protein